LISRLRAERLLTVIALSLLALLSGCSSEMYCINPEPCAGPVSSLFFSASKLTASEASHSITLSVQRTGDASGAVSVAYSTADGSSLSGVGYTAVKGTLSWAAGDMAAKTFTVPILDEQLSGGSQSFTVTLSAASTGAILGSPASATISILDDDPPPGVLQLSADSYSVNNNAGYVTLQVTRTGGSRGAVSVGYSSSDGSAQAGVDYTAVNGTLQWNDGDATARTLSIPIVNPELTESSKSFGVSLAQATGGATLGSPNSATVTILESDGSAGTVQFSSSTYSVDEAGGSVIIPVVRTGGLDAVSVVASTQNGTAISPAAYSGLSQTLSWGNGDTSPKNLVIRIVDQQLTTGSQSFTVGLSSASGGPSLASVTINDNDPAIVVSLTANNGSRVRVGNTLTYQATLSNTANTGLTWTVNGIPNGNAQVGTVVANANGTATYTAPLQVPAPNNVVTLTAASTLQPAATASLLIAVQNPIPTLSTATPGSVGPGANTIVLSGANFVAGSQVFVNGSAVAATYNNSGQMTVSANLPVAGTYLFNVFNPDPGGAASAALPVTVNGNVPAPLVSPQDASRRFDLGWHLAVILRASHQWPRPTAAACGVCAQSVPRHLQRQRRRNCLAGARLRSVLRCAGERWTGQLPPAAAGCDAESGDGTVPLHATERGPEPVGASG
jgi:hypothetical protein